MLRTAILLLLAITVSACKQEAPSSTATEEAPVTNSSHLGQAFSDAPKVDIATLLDSPADYQGKTVQLSGDVIAMCHHKRDWFALVPKGSHKGNVRVLTGPVFQVPEDAIGKTASTEGTVDLVEISERVAKHFAETHQLGELSAVSGPVQQVVVRATGARFN